MGIQEWHNACREEIPKIIDSEPTEKRAIFFNALLGIMRHGNPEEIQTYQPVSENEILGEIEPIQTRFKAVDFVPESILDEKMQEQLEVFIEYMRQKRLFQTTNVQLHNDYAYEALKNMLKINSDISTMLYKAADEKEKMLIKKSHEDILKNFKP